MAEGYVVYGVDIGVYREDNPKLKSTFAWARIENDYSKCEKTKPNNDNSGKSIRCLATKINCDLKNNKKIALGFEAPMWIPVEDLKKDGNLFKKRFEAEGSKYRWYLQSGAAATLKSIVIGKNLFGLLIKDIQFTTSPEDWKNGNKILLFEGFAAGNYKGEIKNEETEHKADARQIACAFIEYVKGNEECKLNKEDYVENSDISVWDIIATQKHKVGCPPDCLVVGIKNNDNRVNTE